MVNLNLNVTQDTLDKIKQQTQKMKQQNTGARWGKPGRSLDVGLPYQGKPWREEGYTPPLNQPQKAQTMKNYDRLTPAERSAYGALPGFSESSIGKAMEKFNNTWVGSKLVLVFDVLAEGAERTSGFVTQAFDAARNGTIDDFKDNIAEAWYAGALTADMANIPVLEGQPVSDEDYQRDFETARTTDPLLAAQMAMHPQQPKARWSVATPDLPGMAGLTSARKRIAQLVDEGMDYGSALVQARDEYYQDLGALAIRAQTQDAFMHLVGDPANYIMPKIAPIERVTALRNLAMTTKYSDEALDALRTMQKGAEEAGNVTEAARLGEVLGKAKGLTTADKVAIAITGGDPLKPGKLASKWNPFALTPSARAQELLTMASDHVNAYIVGKMDDPHEIAAAISRAYNGGMGDEFGHAFVNMEGRVAQAALMGIDAQSQDLVKAWDMLAGERNALQKIAGAVGSDPYQVMATITRNDPQELAKLAARVGTNPEELTRIGALLKDVPFTKDLFKLELTNRVLDMAAEFGVTLFGVKSRGFVQKLSNAMKAGETLAFLRLNPAYPIKNAVNNEVTLLARGLSGVKIDDIEKLIDDLGFEPMRMGQGIGMAGETLTTGEPYIAGRAIAKALRGDKSKLEDFSDWVNRIKLGKLDMSTAAQGAERAASRRAFTAGYLQGWRKYFWKPGKGFDSLGASISSASADAINQIDPNLIRSFDNAVASAVKEGDIDAFARGDLNLNIKSIMEDASKRAGFDIEGVLPDDFVAKYEKGLVDAAKKGTVREYMTDVRAGLQKHLDELSGDAKEIAASQVKARIAAEGPKGILRVYGDAMDDFWSGHTAHAMRMQDLGDTIKGVSTKEIRNAMWRKVQDDNAAHFGRYWDRLEGTVQGIKQGAKHAGFEFPDKVYNTVKEWKKGWKDFFNYRNTEIQKLVDLENAGKPHREWDELMIDIDTRYRSMVDLEDGYLKVMDNVVADMLPDPRMRDPFMAWRNKAAELRMRDKQSVIDFRDAVKGLSPDQRNIAYTQWWKERYAAWQEMWANEKQGLMMLQGDPQATMRYETLADIDAQKLAQSAPPPAAAEAVAAPAEAAKVAPVDRTFVADLDPIAPPEPPIQQAEMEFWNTRGFRGLDALEEAAVDAGKKKPLKWDSLPDNVKAEMERHIAKVKGQMSDARYASIRYGEFKRDSALLNYNRRYNYNTWLSAIMPYEFWLTQSMAKWALHTIDRPAMVSTYLKMRKFLETSGASDQALPSRLKGTVRIPMPFLPDWMGDSVFIDPLRLALPFDNFIYPYQQFKQLMTTRDGRTMRLIEDKVNQGLITREEAEAAKADKNSEIWKDAETEVLDNDANMRYDAFDFAQTFSSPHAPLVWAAEALKGTPEDIGPFLPLSRTMKGAAGLLGIDWTNSPYNLEAKIRKAIGLPAFDKCDDYRIDRMITNMAGRNEITAEEAKRAMIDRSGDVYDEAVRKANIEFGVGTIGATVGMPIRAYPEGEFLQRSLADDFDRAYKRYNSGDVDALTDFFERHPEYEARLALFKKPEERLHQFMVDELWSQYNSLGSLNKKIVREQLGDEFNEAFLSKETRSYESISPEAMQTWLRLMGGDPPGTLTGNVRPIDLAPPDVAQTAQMFYDYRNQNFPNFYEEQSTYFDLAEGQPRRNYLKTHPNLVPYWDWRRDFLKRNPDVVPYLDDSFEPNYSSEAERTSALETQPAFSAEEWRMSIGDSMYNLIGDYARNGKSLSPTAQKRLDKLAEEYGMDADELLETIANSLR